MCYPYTISALRNPIRNTMQSSHLPQEEPRNASCSCQRVVFAVCLGHRHGLFLASRQEAEAEAASVRHRSGDASVRTLQRAAVQLHLPHVWLGNNAQLWDWANKRVWSDNLRGAVVVCWCVHPDSGGLFPQRDVWSNNCAVLLLLLMPSLQRAVFVINIVINAHSPLDPICFVVF